MSNKYTDPMDLLRTFAKMAATDPNIYSFFRGMPKTQPYADLGHGYELRPIEMKDEKGNSIPNREKYSNLYRDAKQISNEIFRKGGMCTGFNDGYCSLIRYTKEKKRDDGFSFGTHVVIDAFGKTMLEGKSSIDYPSHIGGNVGRMGETFYNLINGEPIIKSSSSNIIYGTNYIILENRYGWYNEKIELGVYRIDMKTCKLEKIDEIKR